MGVADVCMRVYVCVCACDTLRVVDLNEVLTTFWGVNRVVFCKCDVFEFYIYFMGQWYLAFFLDAI